MLEPPVGVHGEITRLKAQGVRFRNDVITGPGGRQILVEDPSGNLVELFQPAERSASQQTT